ncbi:TonB-dependent receptor plug domain-containing protein [Schleiferia thermophila]|jgi:iron complex outermembrane receptor protein|uniref:TonB-dependent receptor plug domain-containing protein n=1 Tax=Schleiferia thermophila TaxID=884107 RepID=UPI0012684245|nr:TonB-dependent receptor [Schleiferia thermophila]
MKKHIFTTTLILQGFICFGQSSLLPEVVVTASKAHFSAIEPIEYTWDSLAARHKDQFSLAEILRLYLPAHVRLYGPGLISTIRVRGQSSEHFKVVWNGLSLNNAALGLFDFSGVPALLFDHLQMYHGNLAGFYGSGSGSGALVLNDLPVKKGFSVNALQAAGSFGYRQRIASLESSAGRWSLKVVNQLQYADNNYPFKNLSNQLQPLANGGYIHHNVTAGAIYRLSDKSAVNISSWFQNSAISIPPSRVESRFNTSRQWNRNQRSVINYTFTGTKLRLAAGGGAIAEQIVYHHDLLGLKDTSEVNGWQFFARGAFSAGKRSVVTYNAEHHRYQAPSANRLPEVGTHISLLNAGYEYQLTDALQLSATLRSEWQDGRASPLIARLAGRYSIANWSIQATGGNHFRWPTLNERYWVPGGNPNILPESGYTADVMISYASKKHRTEGKIFLTPFVQSLENQIIWQPQGSLWSPVNLRKTFAGGAETRVEGSVQLFSNTLAHLIVAYTYCRNVIQGSDAAAGKLAIYTPQHIGNAHLGVKTQVWHAGVQMVYQSSQHTLSDNHPSGILPGFTVLNLLVSRFVSLQKFTLRLSGEVRNLANTEYAYIPHRPMPGREFRFTVNLQFTNPKYTKS